VGLLGEDRSAEFTTDKIMAMDVNYDLDSRKAYQAKVEEERVAKVAAKQEELATLAGEMSDIKLLTAVATKGSGLINEHFGHAKGSRYGSFLPLVQSLSAHRRAIFIARALWRGNSLETIIRAINDCHAVFVAKIGGCLKSDLIKAGIEPVDQFAHSRFIEKSTKLRSRILER